jgi:hypothetical protein
MARKPPDSDTPSALVIRGLTAEEHTALDALVERRREALQAQAPGAYLSRNAVVLDILRAALRGAS